MNLKEEIIQSLPRVCPIESVENYRFKSNESWKDHIEEINYRIDDFNEKFVTKGLDKMNDEAFDDLPLLPNLSGECVILNGSFGERDNQYIKAHKNIQEKKRLALYGIINPGNCWVINNGYDVLKKVSLYPMIEALDEKDFLYGFNNSLLKYAKKKLALEKKNDLDTRDSQWERSVRELVHWFSNNKLEAKTDSESKIETNDALWAIADDLRDRKNNGEFETFRDGYRWAEKNISKKGVDITFIKLERAYHKANNEGRIE